MKSLTSLFNKLRVHHTRNDIYDTGVVGVSGNLPLPYRLTIKDTSEPGFGRSRLLNLHARREKGINAPKPIDFQPLLDTSIYTKAASVPTNTNPTATSRGIIPRSLGSSSPLYPENAPPLGLLSSIGIGKSTDLHEMMAFYFRIIPDRRVPDEDLQEHNDRFTTTSGIPRFQKYEFTISKEANKMCQYVFTSLGLSKMVGMLFLSEHLCPEREEMGSESIIGSARNAANM